MRSSQPASHGGRKVGNLGGVASSVFLGAANGYLVLHPAAMAIFKALHGGRDEMFSSSLASSVAWAIADAFNVHMFPMAMAFTVLGAAVGTVYGLQRRVIERQKVDLLLDLATQNELRRRLEDDKSTLARQNTQLQRLQEAKRQTTHFLVHDFKHHLGCIDGYADILLEHATNADDRETAQALECIRRQARLMLCSVKNVLDVEWLQGKPPLQLEKIEPQRALECVRDDLAFVGRRATLTLSPVDSSCPPIWADADLLHRALLNLVVNAISHNTPGVCIRLSAEPVDEGTAVKFTCQDDGIGLDADQAASVAGPAASTEDFVERRHGLGLAFVRATVAAHGGKFWYERNSTGESCFHFTFATHRIHRRKDDMDTKTTRDTVLIVEDDPDYGELIKRMVQRLGYAAEIAYDGEAALLMVDAKSPVAISLDLELPARSGILLYRQLKSDPKRRDIPVIVVTGLSPSNAVAKTFWSRFVDGGRFPHPEAFLRKPINEEEFSEVLARATREVSHQRELASVQCPIASA